MIIYNKTVIFNKIHLTSGIFSLYFCVKRKAKCFKAVLGTILDYIYVFSKWPDNFLMYYNYWVLCKLIHLSTIIMIISNVFSEVAKTYTYFQIIWGTWVHASDIRFSSWDDINSYASLNYFRMIPGVYVKVYICI